MTTGIYKITNLINQHCYIGQSRTIERRWLDHKENAYNVNQSAYKYPLQQAFRKYGIENFTFEILEECPIEQLNEKEIYWINKFKPYYNQTTGGNYNIVPQKLTQEQVNEIQQLLINDVDSKISHKALAEQYHVSKDTIRDINVGRTWFNPNLIYPLHYSKFDYRKGYSLHSKYRCIDCGAELSHKSNKRCISCEQKRRQIQASANKPVSRKELKELIRTTPFTHIGLMFNVSQSTIRRWCEKYNLPSKVSIIKTISDKDWETI